MRLLTRWRFIGDSPLTEWVGHGLFRTKTSGGFMIGHEGDVLGYTASMKWLEDGDFVLVVLSNAGAMHTGSGNVRAYGIAHDSEFRRLARLFAKQHAR